MKVLLVDDEKPARDRLSRLLRAYPDVEVVGFAAHGLEALTEMARLTPDVIFLDIDMPELDGLETAAAIGPDGPAIIFVTAYDGYALQAFDAHAVDYLVKPVTVERLAAAIKKLHRRRQSATDPALIEMLRQMGSQRRRGRFAVKLGQHYVVFHQDDVSAIIARDHYSEILHGEARSLADDSLDSLEARLDPSQFLRIHRSSIVNLDFVKEVRRDGDRKLTAVLSDHAGTELAISRENIEKVKSRLAM